MERSGEPFADRTQAGAELGRALKKITRESAVVLGIPRGGVVVAWSLALELNAQLDIVLSRKIGAPGNPEFALGAVAEDGGVFVNREYLARAGADEGYIEREKERQLAEIRRRREMFRKICPKTPLKDRVVIVTDDGVATGATFEAAVWAVRQEAPRQLVAAIPVGPRDTLTRLARQVDQLVCLRASDSFFALSQFYLEFPQIEDEEILRILDACRQHTPE